MGNLLNIADNPKDGLEMIKDLFEANKSMSLAVGRVELQLDRYDEWRDIWRNDEGSDLKFENFAKSNPSTAGRIYRQLSLMSQALFDAKALEDDYGFKLGERPNREPKDLNTFHLKTGQVLLVGKAQDSFLESCKTNMSFILKCKFVFRKKETQWSKLIDLLKEYNENLSTYGPKVDLVKMLKGEFDVLRRLQQEELQRRAEASTYEARNLSSDKEHRGRYHEMSLAANFSVVVKYERQHEAYKFSMLDFRLDAAYAVSSGNDSTMALLFDYPVRREHRVVLIEWIQDLDRDQERDTRIKTLMLATPKPGQLLLPICYGMVEDPAARRFGLVLAPPAHIRSNLPRLLPAGAISRMRMPVSLKELLQRKHPSCPYILDLGIRFRLAKKLVDAIHMMHCVGWVHKNIRSNSILFFPARGPLYRGHPAPAEVFPQPLGYDEPLFVGLGNARIDDAVRDHHNVYSDRDEEDLLEDWRAGSKNRHRPYHSKRPHDINLNYYQHPDKRWNPSLKYSRAHDIYSLGCLLLEIGLWKSLDQVVDTEEENYTETTKQFQKKALKLDGLMGSIYGNVVRRCLAINTSERTEAEMSNINLLLTSSFPFSLFDRPYSTILLLLLIYSINLLPKYQKKKKSIAADEEEEGKYQRLLIELENMKKEISRKRKQDMEEKLKLTGSPDISYRKWRDWAGWKWRWRATIRILQPFPEIQKQHPYNINIMLFFPPFDPNMSIVAMDVDPPTPPPAIKSSDVVMPLPTHSDTTSSSSHAESSETDMDITMLELGDLMDIMWVTVVEISTPALDGNLNSFDTVMDVDVQSTRAVPEEEDEAMDGVFALTKEMQVLSLEEEVQEVEMQDWLPSEHSVEFGDVTISREEIFRMR
ncbi:hypothetical protein B7494_g2967 [Chlorociboria aeruginascens]|nr:hypothetical protein B7494_g2967 [Chlorociboria aeruginascens]